MSALPISTNSPSAKPKHRPGNVLIIEDDAALAEAMALILMREGYGIRAVPDRDAALSALSAYLYDVVIMDLFMPGMGPEDFILRARKASPRSKFILLTAVAHVSDYARVLGIGAWLGKPFEPDKLIMAVDDCL